MIKLIQSNMKTNCSNCRLGWAWLSINGSPPLILCYRYSIGDEASYFMGFLTTSSQNMHSRNWFVFQDDPIKNEGCHWWTKDSYHPDFKELEQIPMFSEFIE